MIHRMPSATSIGVANYFIKKGRRYGGITLARLRVLVYLAHGWYLARQDKPLIDEYVEAWVFGPVISSIFQNQDVWGVERITDLLYDINIYKMARELPIIQDPDLMRFLDEVWSEFMEYSTYELSKAVKSPDTPWDQVAREFNYRPPRNINIPNELIKKYFLEVMAEEAAQQG